jgi:hypothetical protein
MDSKTCYLGNSGVEIVFLASIWLQIIHMNEYIDAELGAFQVNIKTRSL